jgi:hypothetical protein
MSSRAERMHRTGKLDDSCAKVTSHVADGCVTGRDQTLLPPGSGTSLRHSRLGADLMKAAPATTSPPMKAAMTAATGARVETPRAAKAIWNESPWKWFFSLGVGVTLLIAITIASIIGTMIDPLPRAQALIYYTWWFKLLLLALAVVMSCSTVKTILVKILPAHELRVRTQKSFYEHAPLRAKIPYHGQVEDVAFAAKATPAPRGPGGSAALAPRFRIWAW